MAGQMGQSTPRGPNPSPEDIRRKCREIQDTWTPQQWAQRVATKIVPWQVPVESVADMESRCDEVVDDTRYTEPV